MGVKLIHAIGIALSRVLIGAIALFILNLFGNFVDFQLPINPITAIVVGLLGVPGLLSLILIKLLLI